MESPLTTDLIADTSYCQLGMRLSAAALDVMIYNPMEDNSMVVRKFPLAADSSGQSLRECFEAIVYDNPLLLGNFQKIFFEVETPEFLVVPSDIDSEEAQKAVFKAAHPSAGEDVTILSNHIEGVGASVLFALPDKLLNFVRRTFDGVRILHNLAPLMIYFRRQLRHAGAIKTLVNVRESSAEVIVMSHNRLLLANRFSFSTVDDLTYYVLAATEQLDVTGHEIYTAGNRQLRTSLTESLRRFRSPVMPLIFPSAIYRAGKVSLSTPFDLVILPLCE